MSFEEVATNDAAVGFAENSVDMQGGSLLGNRHIAEERENLDCSSTAIFLYSLLCQSKYPSRAR